MEETRCHGGSLINDIDYYNRLREMTHILTSKANRENDDVEGFGYKRTSSQNWTPSTDANLATTLPRIPGGAVAGTTASPSANVFSHIHMISSASLNLLHWLEMMHLMPLLSL